MMCIHILAVYLYCHKDWSYLIHYRYITRNYHEIFDRKLKLLDLKEITGLNHCATPITIHDRLVQMKRYKYWFEAKNKPKNKK